MGEESRGDALVPNTVLLESKLEKSFWPHAVEFCSYVRNRVPCKPHCKTPMEVAFRQKPDVSQMHIFGEECFVLKTPANKSGKLDANCGSCEVTRRSTTC